MKTRYIATFLYIMVYSFGQVWGYLKSGSWHIRDWGFFTSKYVSLWWIGMGMTVTLVCGALWIFRHISKDHDSKLDADRMLND